MYLGIDQGTTGTTAVLLNEKGESLGSFTSPVPQHFPQPGWVEHDPDEIFTSVGAAVTGLLNRLDISARQIRQIGITNQRETISLFEDDRPLHRFIVWQDRRTAPECEKLQKHAARLRQLSGTPIDPYFSSTKIHWLLKKLKPKRSKSLRFRTIDSFLFRKLCGEDATEVSNAHRTQLVGLKSGRWDPRLFDLFRIPESLAPKIIPSGGFGFKTRGLSFLPDGIPVNACLGDQQAALFGQGGWVAGKGKITFGTGSFILLHTGKKPVFSRNKLVSTIAAQWKNGELNYALEGSVFVSGAWIQWLRDQLQVIGSSDEVESLARSCTSPEGVFVIPALTGLGAPFWRPHARGAILGLTRGSGRPQIARASLEALCFQNTALIEAMKKDLGSAKLKEWRVDGGAVRNDLLLEIQAHLLKTVVVRPKNLEATASGVALLAAHSVGELSLQDIERSLSVDKKFLPNPSLLKSLQSRFAEWKKYALMTSAD